VTAVSASACRIPSCDTASAMTSGRDTVGDEPGLKSVARASAHLVVSGLVQGVFYRQSAVDEARSLGLDGWVRNLPDGRVEAEAEGERDRVEAFVAWCRRGPPSARVDDVEATWGAPSAAAGRGFAVRR